VLPRLTIALALTLSASALAQSSNVVISQIYAAGGNNGATYRNDFIELFNRGSNAVTLNGWSLQYASAAGTTWQVAPLTNTIAPGRYYLVQQSSGGTNGGNLPSADVVGSISMGATAGKVALVNNSTALSGSCPLPNAAVIDLVGYGTTASCFEGNRVPAHGASTSLRRAFEGCVDSDDNASDFFIAAVTPRNSATPAHSCDVMPRAFAIHELQGTNSTSPLVGQPVTTTTNIVTGVRNNGFFIQTPPGDEDDDILSSEGIFVFTGNTPGTNASFGHAVVVSGTVAEFRPATDPASPSRTQLNATHTRFVSAVNSIPAEIALSDNAPRADRGHEQLERFEGMRVTASFMSVVAPTGGFVNEANATAASDGVFYAVLGSRPLREPGIDIFEPAPSDAPCCVPRFDGNPEILRIDSNGQLGAVALEVKARATVANIHGPLYYEQRRYTILPNAFSPPRVHQDAVFPPHPPLVTNKVSIACLNLERFYDDLDHQGVGDVVLTSTAYSNRLHKAALLLRDGMQSPDILGLAEVENLSVLQDIAATTSNSYSAWLMPGNDSGGINVGFLVNTSRVQVLDVTQHGKTATFTHPGTGMPATLHDRPPLVLRTMIPDPRSTNTLSLTVIMNHLRSLLDIADEESGPFVRAKRRAQAEYLAQLAQQRQAMGEHVIVMGDFNAFEFNDGYVDVMGTITGSPTPSNNVVLASADFVEPNLINLIETLHPSARYSYVFAGSAQALDHMLISQSLRLRVRRFLYVRNNADFPESLRSDPNNSRRISDHDAAMVELWLGVLTRITSIQRDDTEIVLEGDANPGRSHDVERSTNLREWQEIGSAAADEAGRFSFRDLNPVSGAAFYRLRADQN
jgi:predicted extracellular nuclease